MEIMTKQGYIDRYMFKTCSEYDAMTKAQLTACIAELANTLQYCGIEFMQPSGDGWDYNCEIRRWCNFNKSKLLPYHDLAENDARLMRRKKSELRQFVVVVDMACGSLFEVTEKHPYHKFQDDFFNAYRNVSKKRRG